MLMRDCAARDSFQKNPTTTVKLALLPGALTHAAVCGNGAPPPLLIGLNIQHRRVKTETTRKKK